MHQGSPGAKRPSKVPIVEVTFHFLGNTWQIIPSCQWKGGAEDVEDFLLQFEWQQIACEMRRGLLVLRLTVLPFGGSRRLTLLLVLWPYCRGLRWRFA